jgi:hypothetical protein
MCLRGADTDCNECGTQSSCFAPQTPASPVDNVFWRDQDGDGCEKYATHPQGAAYACNYPGYEVAQQMCIKTCGAVLNPPVDRVGIVVDAPAPALAPPGLCAAGTTACECVSLTESGCGWDSTLSKCTQDGFTECQECPRMTVCMTDASGSLRSSCRSATTACSCARRGSYLSCGWNRVSNTCGYGSTTQCSECSEMESCTQEPTAQPTLFPTRRPTLFPTQSPTTLRPTVEPTPEPTQLTTRPTAALQLDPRASACRTALTACDCAVRRHLSCGWSTFDGACMSGAETDCDECEWQEQCYRTGRL